MILLAVISNTMRRGRLLVTTRTAYQRQLAVISSRLHLCGREAETVHVFLCMPKEVPCAGLWSRSRGLGLEVSVSRRTNISSRSRLEKNCQRLGLVSVSAKEVPCAGLWSRSRDGLETYQRLVSVSSRGKLSSSRSRPITSRAQDQFSAKLCRPH